MICLPKLKVIFISGNPTSVSHRFRVLHAAKYLEKANFEVYIFRADQNIDKTHFSNCRAVVIFRAEWDSNLNQIIRFCKRKKIPICFDIDDLIFDKIIIDKGYWAYYSDLSKDEKMIWEKRIVGYQKTMQHCDMAIFSTPFLAEAGRSYCQKTYFLPNTLDENMIKLVRNATQQIKPSDLDNIIRLGFASGTPTHTRDFRVVVNTLKRILLKYQNVMLTIVGNLNIADYPELNEFEHQIEVRPMVSMDELFQEIYRFDINMAPLEVPNPFCEAKSSLRFLFAAALKIPSVVSPTQPLMEAAGYGAYGLIAKNEDEWYEALRSLIENPVTRLDLGISAEKNTIAKFGPESGRKQTLKILENITARNDKKAKVLIQKLLHFMGSLIRTIVRPRFHL